MSVWDNDPNYDCQILILVFGQKENKLENDLLLCLTYISYYLNYISYHTKIIKDWKLTVVRAL